MRGSNHKSGRGSGVCMAHVSSALRKSPGIADIHEIIQTINAAAPDGIVQRRRMPPHAPSRIPDYDAAAQGDDDDVNDEEYDEEYADADDTDDYNADGNAAAKNSTSSSAHLLQLPKHTCPLSAPRMAVVIGDVWRELFPNATRPLCAVSFEHGHGSVFYAALAASDCMFVMQSDAAQAVAVAALKRRMVERLDELFAAFQYSLYGYSKDVIAQVLWQTGEQYHPSVVHYLADFMQWHVGIIDFAVSAKTGAQCWDGCESIADLASMGASFRWMSAAKTRRADGIEPQSAALFFAFAGGMGALVSGEPGNPHASPALERIAEKLRPTPSSVRPAPRLRIIHDDDQRKTTDDNKEKTDDAAIRDEEHGSKSDTAAAVAASAAVPCSSESELRATLQKMRFGDVQAEAARLGIATLRTNSHRPRLKADLISDICAALVR